MFKGESQHSLDVKGRLTVPVKFRDELGLNFVATKGLERCIFLFPQDAWEEFEARIRPLSLGNKKARSVARFFFSGAADLEMDKQGRVLIPQNLREYAGIDKDLVVIGIDSRVEIWSAEAWSAYHADAEQTFEANAEDLFDLGI